MKFELNLRQKPVQDNLGKLRQNNGFALPKKDLEYIQSDISTVVVEPRRLGKLNKISELS